MFGYILNYPHKYKQQKLTIPLMAIRQIYIEILMGKLNRWEKLGHTFYVLWRPTPKAEMKLLGVDMESLNIEISFHFMRIWG